MFTFGLLGIEYDGSIQYLKRHIEDRGHKTKIINLTHVPRVVQSTVSSNAIVHDGHNLLDFDCYYLAEMGVREPFFHVTYDRELWSTLRGRYLTFAAAEVDNVNFTAALIDALAAVRPMVNSPRVYSQRLHLPYQLGLLGARAFKVPPFKVASDQPDGFEESSPLKLDEDKTWEVLSSPKKVHTSLRIWQKKPPGTTYKIIVLGTRPFEDAVRISEPAKPPEKVTTASLPREVAETALKAARELGVKFGEVTCILSDDEVWIRQIDPSPDLQILEETYRLRVSSALASYLIETAANA